MVVRPGGANGSSRTEVRLQFWQCPCCAGDWEQAWDIFEKTLPVDTPDMPGVLEIMALDTEAEEKAARRQRELDLQVWLLRQRPYIPHNMKRRSS